MRPRRSVLYMPGSNLRALEKAKGLASDCVILDLEDGVAPDAKDIARRQVVQAVMAGGFGHREIVIRINTLETSQGLEDLEAAISALPDAILIPKVQSADDILTVRKIIKSRPASKSIALWAMIETPPAILNIKPVAENAHDAEVPLVCFVLGTNDLVKETRVQPGAERAHLIPWLMTIIVAARAYGIDVLDGVYTLLHDADGFAAECKQGRALGMDGKTLIHPNQIDTCNAIFSPAAEEIAWARRVMEAFDEAGNRGKGAINLDGRMVELLHVEMAKRTLAFNEAVLMRQNERRD